MDELPEWPEGTVAVLSTGAGAPHAIPVSTAVRRGPMELAFALAHSRGSLARLREDPRCAVTVMAAGVAFTAHGRATVEAEHDKVVVVRLDVVDVQDHDRPTFALESGVAWRWTDEAARRGDEEVRALVRRRPAGAPPPGGPPPGSTRWPPRRRARPR